MGRITSSTPMGQNVMYVRCPNCHEVLMFIANVVKVDLHLDGKMHLDLHAAPQNHMCWDTNHE